MNTRENRVFFVTGCSTGFGRHIAEHLLEQGQRVVVTARKTDKVADLARPGQSLVLALDVSDAAQCKAAVAQALAQFGRLDVLVNNAGVGYFAAVEETSQEQARQLIEVNFFGAANMIHAVLPSMRARRSGCIVNLTSIGGISGFEAVGYYSASKFALEGLSDTLAKELGPLGVKVITVEPSGFRTEWAGSANETDSPIADYDITAGKARRAYHASVGKQAGDPRRAAAAIFQAVCAERPPRYLLLGNEAMEVGMAKLEEMRADFTAWEKVSRSADFPPNEA